MSELGISFIGECLTLSADLRPTAGELLSHEWILPVYQQITDHNSYGGAASGTQSFSSRSESQYYPQQEQYEGEYGTDRHEQYETAQGASVDHAEEGRQMPDYAHLVNQLNAAASVANDHTLFDDTPSVSGTFRPI